MANKWQKKELDIEILKLIDEHKALIGKSIVEKIIRDFHPELKGTQIYNRLAGLCRVEMLERTTYKLTSRKACRKAGTLYSLSRNAVRELNAMGIPVKYKQVKSRDLDGLYLHSRLLEDIPLQLVNGSTYKIQNKIQNFGIVDFVYNDWEMVVQRSSDKDYENILVHQAKMADKNGRIKRLYLCKNRPQMINLIKRFMDEHVNTGLFVVFNDTATITRILENRAQVAIDEYLSTAYGIQQLTPLQYEKPAGEIVKVYNLIGYNSKLIRQLKREQEVAYVGFANTSDKDYFNKRFPNILKMHRPFTIDDGAAELEEVFIDKTQREDPVIIDKAIYETDIDEQQTNEDLPVESSTISTPRNVEYDRWGETLD